MGYRSEVAILINDAGYDCMCFQLEELEPSVRIDVVSLIDEMEREYGNNIMLYEEWVKWYEDFPEVRFMEDMLEVLECSNLPYVFLRIGENLEDIEHRDFMTEEFDDVPYISRSIDF